MSIRQVQVRQFLATFRFLFTRSQIFTKVISLVLMIALLSNTTFAIVPGEVLMVTTNELGQDVRYAFLTNPTLQSILDTLTDNPVLAFIKGKTSKKQQTIARIQIQPENVVIKDGEELNLIAVALDSQGNPINGIGFKWSAEMVDKKVKPMPVPNGVFKPNFPGKFNIVAEAGGMKGASFVYVEKDPHLKAMQEVAELKRLEASEDQKAKSTNNGRLKKLPFEARELLKEPLPVPILGSSKMSNEEKKTLYDWDQTEKKRTDPLKRNRKSPPQTPPQNPVSIITEENTNDEESVDEKADEEKSFFKKIKYTTDDDSNRNESNEYENASTKLQLGGTVAIDYPSSSFRLMVGTNTTVTARVYVNGPIGTGTLVATRAISPAYVGGPAGWYPPVPAQYQDGNSHTYYAYVNYSGSTWTPLAGSGNSFIFPPYNNSGYNNDNFNTANSPTVGDFSFVAPILSLPGRGLDVSLNMHYNSLVWHQAGSNITYDIDKGSPAPGWNLGFGKMMDMGSVGGAMVVDNDGTKHSYKYYIQAGYTSGYSTIYGKTIDGSFIDYIAYRTPSGLSSAKAFLPDGTVVTYGAFNNKVLYPTNITDRHGNYLNITYQDNQGPNITNVTDSLGRVITFNYDPNINRVVSISGSGQNGGTRVYARIHYTQQTLNYSFSGLTPIIANNNIYQIDAIYYPDLNKGYWFGDTDSYSSYGMIAKVKEMRGMSWSGSGNNDMGTITQGTMSREMVYDYPLSPASLTTPPQYSSMTESWANMDTAPVVTNYSINSFANPRTTLISMPNGNKVKESRYYSPSNFQDNLLYQKELLSSTNQVLSKTVYEWGQSSKYSSPQITRIDTTDEKSQTLTTRFFYNDYGQVISKLEYNYNVSNVYATPPFRRTAYTYEESANYIGNYSFYSSYYYWTGGRHIFGLVKSEEIFDASNVRLSKTEFNYDQATLMDTPSVVMYNQVNNPHTSETTQGSSCLYGEFNNPNCTYEGEYVPIPEVMNEYEYCTFQCYEYEQISIFDSSTLYRGNLTQVTKYVDAANSSGAIPYQYSYDITGNTRTATTDCCQQMSFTYSTATQYSQPDNQSKGSATDPNLRNTVSATYDFNTGLTKTATNANGRTTQYSYDDALRPTGTLYSTGLQTQIWYHPGSNAYNELIWQGGSYTHVENHFNGRGQQILRSEYNKKTGNYWDQDNFTDTNFTYDVMGRRATVSVPHQKNIPTAGNSTYQYDLLSRVTQVTAPDGSTSKTFYNEGTKPSSAASNVGNTVRSQDAWGRERWARTDDFGRLVEVVEPDPNGNGSVMAANNMVTTYIYDPMDQLTQVNQGSQVRAFRYDSLGRLTRQKLAEQNHSINDAGAYVGPNNGQWSDAFVYDNRSNLIQRTDARGVKTNFDYANDPLNRLQTVSYDQTGAHNSSSITPASTVWLHYMSTGDKTRVRKADTWSTSEENVYDIEGRISEYKMTNANNTSHPFVTNYLYDSLSRLTEIRYPAQYGMAGNPRKVITPEYDETSRLKELKVDNQIQMNEIVYNPLSQVTQLKVGAATGNADVEQYSYDGQTGLLTNQKVIKQNTSTTILDLSYNYNRGSSNGSINGKTGQLTNIVDNLNRNRDRVYEFDSLGRLRNAKGGVAAGGSGTANWGQQYTYDRYGNRTNVTASGVTQDSQPVPLDGNGAMNYDDTSNRINTANYEYDLTGNLIKGQKPDGTWQRYTYDAAGRLTQVLNDSDSWVQQYNEYGSSRQRSRSWSYASVDITYYVWGGSSVIAEYKAPSSNLSALSWFKSYIYAGSRLLSTFTNNGGGGETLEFHHPDRLGTKLVTNNTANTAYQQSTLPFGTALNAESTGYSNQVFTSYDRSNVAQLDYAVNRSYSSGQGRFTTVDPIGMGASSIANPQSLNMFAYVENNPIDFTDPSGLDIYGSGGGSSGGGSGGLNINFGGFFTALFGSLLNSNRTPTFMFRSVFFPATKDNNVGTVRDVKPASNPCAVMAQVAEEIAKKILGESKGAGWGKLVAFTRIMQTLYTGGWVGLTYGSAYAFKRFYDKSGSDKGVGTTTGEYGTVSMLEHNDWSDPDIFGNRTLIKSSDYRGQKDFKDIFYEKTKKGDGEDQTHHAMFFFALGVANLSAAKKWYNYWREDTGNDPDLKLGETAYELGQSFFKRKDNLFNAKNLFKEAFCK